jgi:hypothetical protein
MDLSLGIDGRMESSDLRVLLAGFLELRVDLGRFSDSGW